jgi:hypothetical protein
LILFRFFFSVPNASIEEVQILVENNEALPLDLACPERLNVQSLTSLP